MDEQHLVRRMKAGDRSAIDTACDGYLCTITMNFSDLP